MFKINNNQIFFKDSLFLAELPSHLDFNRIVSILNDSCESLQLNPDKLIFIYYKDFENWYHQKEFEKWILTRPQVIQDLAKKISSGYV